MAKWTIKKGWHTSLSNLWQRIIPKWNDTPVMYYFKISKENWYPFIEPDDLDINKLCGFSFGKHHKNSVRVGWTPDFTNSNRFTLHFYLYNGGIRKMAKFVDIQADTDYSVKISFIKQLGYVTFTLFNSDGYEIARGSEKFIVPENRPGYYLWFYFGGNKVAPKKMICWLRKRRNF